MDAPTGETLPYNPNNRILSHADLNRLLQDNGVAAAPRDISIYRLAMVHKSYCTRKNENFVDGNANCPDDCMALQENSNERLEFLGDSVLSLIVASYLYERYPDSEEGFLTKMRTKLVNGEMLAFLSKTIGLGNHVMLSKQIEENNGRVNTKILEDTFEALLGAIFLDLGLDMARAFILNIIESNLDFADLVSSNSNYKDTLIKYIQHNYGYVPRYCDMKISTKDISICIKNKEGITIATGKGPNKKLAESNASLNALKYFGQV